MSWFSKSLTGLLEGGKQVASDEDSEPFSPSKSVKEDLSELGKHFWGGVASFLAPPPAERVDPEEEDTEMVESSTSQVQSLDGSSAPGSPKISGFRNDIEELKGGFAKGLSRLSSVIRVVAGEDNEHSPKGDEKEEGRLNTLLKPLIGGILDEAKPNEETDAEAGNDEQGVSRSLPERLVSGIDEISKLASSIFPFVHEEDGEELWEAPGMTDEVVGFARNISKHPETWLDFPFVSDGEAFEMNSFQKEHAKAVEQAAPRLAALKQELCPEHMSEGHFWKVYFVLLHSRLGEADASLLSSTQVAEARKILLEHLREREETHDLGDVLETDVVIDKDAIESTVKLSAPQQQQQEAKQKVEELADEWLENEPAVDASTAQAARHVTTSGEDEDISFSDLEDEDGGASTQEQGSSASDKNSQAGGGWVQLETADSKHKRMASNEWLTVDQEDVGGGGGAASAAANS